MRLAAGDVRFKHKAGAPVNGKQDANVIIAVSDDDAKTLVPGGWKGPKPCLRIVEQPG